MWWHRDWMMRGMHPGEAPHCTADGMKRVLSESAADAFIAVSKGGLKKQRCSVVPEAWHLTTDEDEEFLAFYRSWQG